MFYLDFLGFLSSALACLTMSSLLPGTGAGLAFPLVEMTFRGMALAGFALTGWALEAVALGGELDELATGGGDPRRCGCWSHGLGYALRNRAGVTVLLTTPNKWAHGQPLWLPVGPSPANGPPSSQAFGRHVLGFALGCNRSPGCRQRQPSHHLVEHVLIDSDGHLGHGLLMFNGHPTNDTCQGLFLRATIAAPLAPPGPRMLGPRVPT